MREIMMKLVREDQEQPDLEIQTENMFMTGPAVPTQVNWITDQTNRHLADQTTARVELQCFLLFSQSRVNRMVRKICTAR